MFSRPKILFLTFVALLNLAKDRITLIGYAFLYNIGDFASYMQISPI